MRDASVTVARAKMPIRPVGHVLFADRDGYLPRIDGARALDLEWRPVVDAAVAAYRACLGDRLHGVCVRGSVARGTAVPGVSDLDMVALAGDEALDGISASLDECAAELVRRYPIASDVELVVVPVNAFLAASRYRSLRFAVSVGGYPLNGADIRTRLAAPRLGPEAVMHAHEVARWRGTAERQLAAARHDEDVRLACRWVMKRIVRSAFELVMLGLNGYTRDLYPCARAAAREYPDRAAALWAALDLAVNPTSDKALVADVVAGFSGWLEQEGRRAFGARGMCGGPRHVVRAEEDVRDIAATAAGR